MFDPQAGGVRCSGCKQYFQGRPNLRRLEPDHIRPWCKGGLTTWENLQLLCRACNREKSGNVQDE
ncbi:MAG: HNH endonuclease [Candidatus Binatia bacterium]